MDSVTLIAILSSIICSAFFSGVEIAFVSANRLKIELDKKQGFISGRILSFFINREDKFITTVLIGNNIALVTFGIFFAELVKPGIELYITHNNVLILLIQSLISTMIIVTVAEFVPKTLFSVDPNFILRLLSVPLAIMYAILWIPTLITSLLSKLLLRLFPGSKHNNGKLQFGRTDLDNYVKQATEIAAPDQKIDHEIHIFKNALAFSKVRARDCMVPRPEIVALEMEASVEELRNKFIETHLSKILIYRETVDDIIGYVHSFEMYRKPADIKSVLRPISFVPETMPGNIVLQEFTRQHRSIAVVVDEFGGTAGIITIEDLLEEIIGEIDDEHDVEELVEIRVSDNEYIFSGRTEIDYINEKYQLFIPTDDEYETLAGYFLKLYQDIPENNVTVETDRLRLTVIEARDHKIEKIKVGLIE